MCCRQTRLSDGNVGQYHTAENSLEDDATLMMMMMIRREQKNGFAYENILEMLLHVNAKRKYRKKTFCFRLTKQSRAVLFYGSLENLREASLEMMSS